METLSTKTVPHWKDERWVSAIPHLGCQANWQGFPQCVPGSCHNEAIYQPLEGWGILETKLDINNNNNGSYGASTIAGGGRFISAVDLNLSYNIVIDIAKRDGKTEAAIALKQQYESHEKSRREWEANKNTVHAAVSCNAHGNCADQKGGSIDITVSAHLVYIGDSNAGTMIRGLMEQYGLSGKGSKTSEALFQHVTYPTPANDETSKDTAQ